MSLQTPNSPTHSSNRSALVAGGTGRVGRAIAERLERDGWAVMAAGRADADLRSPDGGRRLVAAALARLGSLDLVVQAAGDGFAPKAWLDVTEADWDAAFDVTAKGTFFLAQAAARALRSSNGLLVVIEDVAAWEPWPAFAPHSAAKAAQAMLTRTLAVALAPDVRVCGIAPGTVTAPAEREAKRAAETLLGRIGTPADVAEAVVYLAGANFVTGTTLVVDGGTLLKTGARPPT